MKVVNLNEKTLTAGWSVTRLSPDIKPVITGLAGCFFVKATFRLQPGGVAGPWDGRPEFPSGDRPLNGKRELGLCYASDFVPYKPHGEFFVLGTARPPSTDLISFPVGARVGDQSKKLLAVGPRNWKRTLLGSMPGDPGMVSGVLLSYANAWGGVNYQRNPLGRGCDTEELPQLELPEALIESRKSSLEPAGFGPLGPLWSQRASKMGTFDKDWVAERWPWWPLDFDWSYFNAAPVGQWFPTYLRGDEEMEFENLHVSHPIYQSRLPGLRARAFLEEVRDDRPDFQEIPLDLDTLWVDMDEEKLVLVWRGRTPVRSLKLTEVNKLFVLLEPLDEPQHPLPYYSALMESAIAAKLPKKPLPPSTPMVDVDAVIAAANTRFAEQFKTLDNLDAIVEQHKQEALSHAAALGMKIPEFAGVGPGSEETLASIQQAISKLQGSSNPQSDALRDALIRAESDIKDLLAFPGEMMKKFGHELEAIKARRKAAEEGGEAVDPAAAKAQGMVGKRFDAQDFSSLNLEGVDFSKSDLKNCRFVGAKLKGAKLVKASLSNCDFSGADLREVNFTAADVKGCHFGGVTWKGAILDRAKFPKAELTGADFSGVTAKHSNMPEAKFAGAKFVGADFSGADLRQSDISRADFSSSTLAGSRFAGVLATGAKFCDADLTGFRAPRNANFTGADLRRVRANGSIWKGSILDKANLQQGQFQRSQLSEISAVETCFDRCEMTGSTFEDAVMTGSILTNANFLRCLFTRADLTAADLSGANLYDSGFWETKLLHAKWPGANIKKTSLDF